MRLKIPLPRAWNRRAKSAILYILALSHYAFTATPGCTWSSDWTGTPSVQPRFRVDCDFETSERKRPGSSVPGSICESMRREGAPAVNRAQPCAGQAATLRPSQR